MDYQIISTLGPSSREAEIWSALVQAGTTGFRLNTSHLSVEELEGWIERLERFYRERGRPLPLVLDLQGSKWRLGTFAPFLLEPGALVRLVEAQAASEPGVLPVPHGDFFRAAGTSSGEIILNDAKISLQIDPSGAAGGGDDPAALLARVVRGGPIGSRKGITFTFSQQRAEALCRKDQQILARVGSRAYVQWAVSYVKDAVEMERAGEAIQAAVGQEAFLIAKIERGPAVEQAPAIAAQAGALWLCRGDLGAEVGLPAMAAAVQHFSAGLGSLAVPALMAGQVLEHMTGEPTPTRSEVCYIYDTLARGYQGLVLSDETATGSYPVESVRAAAMFRTGG